MRSFRRRRSEESEVKRISWIALGLALAGFFTAGAARADEGHGNESEEGGAGEVSAAGTVQEQLDALRSELRDLRATVDLLMPSVTMLMPDLAERFHVMHRAGDAEDWAVAMHELLAMERIVKVAKRSEPDRAPMFDAFMGQPFEDLELAIEHANQEDFNKALKLTITNCNACHKAAGSPFIEVVLDARSSISMRHPHKLDMSKPPTGHTH